MPNPYVTSESVIGWYVGATKRKLPRELTHKDVLPVVEVVNRLIESKYNDRELHIVVSSTDAISDLDELVDKTDIDTVARIQSPLLVLTRHLPSVIEVFARNELDPLGAHRLKELQSAISALQENAAYLFQQSKRGGRDRSWHKLAKILRDTIEKVWRSLGRTRLSVKADGPLVLVLACALRAVTGEATSPSAISTELKRSRRQLGGS